MKKKRIIISLVIIANIIILCLILLKITKPKAPEDTSFISITTEENRRIYPENSYQFVRLYSGVTDVDKFYLKLYKTVQYLERIADLKNEIEKNGKEQFFKENRNTISRYTGINNYKDFEKFVILANKYKTGNAYKNIVLLPESFEKTKEYDTIILNINLNNGEKLIFKVYMGNINETEGFIKILPM